MPERMYSQREMEQMEQRIEEEASGARAGRKEVEDLRVLLAVANKELEKLREQQRILNVAAEGRVSGFEYEATYALLSLMDSEELPHDFQTMPDYHAIFACFLARVAEAYGCATALGPGDVCHVKAMFMRVAASVLALTYWFDHVGGAGEVPVVPMQQRREAEIRRVLEHAMSIITDAKATAGQVNQTMLKSCATVAIENTMTVWRTGRLVAEVEEKTI